MTKRKAFILLALIFLLSFAACSQKGSGAMTQTADGITGVLTLDPDPPETMIPVTFSLELSDENGQPVENADVSYDLTMPAMKMPPNKPSADEQQNGLYQTRTTLSMAGDWQAEASINLNGKITTLIFDFKVK
jgi:nitrogen fixation protein FixH